ncbi:MAG: hypothetical protein IKG98_12285 [Ruminococcus sp.]|nr:hypothetical protein [Ruminococcus sp.]
MKKKTLTGYIVDGVIYDLDTSLLICKSEEIMNDTALYYSKNKNFFIVERDKIYGKISAIKPVVPEEAMKYANSNVETINQQNYVTAFGKLKEG